MEYKINLFGGNGGNEGKSAWMKRLTTGVYQVYPVQSSYQDYYCDPMYILEYNTNYGITKLNVIVSQIPVPDCDARIVMFDGEKREVIDKWTFRNESGIPTVYVLSKMKKVLPTSHSQQINGENIIEIDSKSWFNCDAPILAILRKLVGNDLQMIERTPILAPLVMY